MLSTRVDLPHVVTVGQTVTAKIRIICMGSGRPTLKYGFVEDPRTYGQRPRATKIMRAAMPCGGTFEFTFEITEAMWQRQLEGYRLGVFCQQSTGGETRIVDGVGVAGTGYFRISKPGTTPMKGIVRVLTRFSKGRYLRIWEDRYENGALNLRNHEFGDCSFHRSTGNKISSRHCKSSIQAFYAIRQSAYNSLAPDEKQYIIDLGLKVVPGNWTPALGEAIPTYKLAGAFTSFPSTIPIEAVPGWGIKLAADALPVTFELQGISCADVTGRSVTPPNIAGQIPVAFAVNGITVATLTPASKVTLDLAASFNQWAGTVTMEKKEVTITAQTDYKKIGGISVPGIMASRTIPIGLEGEIVTAPAPPAPEEAKEGDKRSPFTCDDGSVIHTEIFSGGAWIPSGEKCPTKVARRVLEIAVPKIAYEGQAINIVARAFCGAAASHDEDANLSIDGAIIGTKKTKAGEVSFKWTAKGVGMRKICISIPASPDCPAPITRCETMMVSAYVAGIQEQIKREKAAYEEKLAELRKRKKIEAGKVAKPGVPGYVKIPASLAGTVIDVGGVKVTVPPGGTTVRVPSGDSIVSVIREGIATSVPVLVSPGEMIDLPTAGLPELPGVPGVL